MDIDNRYIVYEYSLNKCLLILANILLILYMLW
jgi:hypothetical protein